MKYEDKSYNENGFILERNGHVRAVYAQLYIWIIVSEWCSYNLAKMVFLNDLKLIQMDVLFHLEFRNASGSWAS